jgi:ankyrin repeat protein
MKASFHGHAKMVALLLNAGANKDAKDKGGFTALLVAAQNGQAACLQLLLDAGADKEAKQIKGATALFIAAQNGHAKCLEMLFNAKVDKNATNAHGCTALLAVAQEGHLQCVKYLLKPGCVVNTLDRDGDSALSVAVVKNHVDCVRALVLYGADISLQVEGRSLDDLADDTNNSDELKAAMRVPAKKRRRCEQCDVTTTGQKMFKCGVCRSVYYCNHDCQKKNWPLHKQVCKAGM